MRHQKTTVKLGRPTAQRVQVLKDLATSLFLFDEIETTVAKAKALRPYAERLITLAKNDTADARKKAATKLAHKNAVKKLFEVIGPLHKERAGGYTRIRKTGVRAGDSGENARISIIK